MILKGKTALVTGAGTGIGRAIARRLAREGLRVALLARRAAMLRGTLKGMPGMGHEVCPCDLRNPEEIDSTIRRIAARWGKLDVLISNAGVGAPAPAVGSDFRIWNEPLTTNFYGSVHLCRAAVPLIPSGGRIVFVTSIHGERVEKDGSSYAASKAALNQYARALALELADRGILVNAVAPGFVDTPMSLGPDGRSELQSEWFKSGYVDGRHLPLRRAAKPEEIAGVIAFLAGPDATYITGHVLMVDGGLSITF